MIAQRGEVRVRLDHIEHTPVLPPQRIAPKIEEIPWNDMIFASVKLRLYLCRISKNGHSHIIRLLLASFPTVLILPCNASLGAQ